MVMTIALSLLGSLIVPHLPQPSQAFRTLELDLAALPQPGVYESRPFSDLVIVPPDQMDDRMVVAPPETVRFEMRVVSPEFELIPRGRGN